MKFVVLALSVIVLICAFGASAQAQAPLTPLRQTPPALSGSDPPLGQTPPAISDTDTDNTTAGQSMDLYKLKANFQLKLTLIVAVFGIIGLIFVAWIFRSAITADTERIVRLVIVVIVVTASLILIAGGYSTDQTAPAFGLFGSIIGYILGSATRHPSGNGDAPADDSTPAADTPVTPPANKPA
jgi:hypothetical protein